MHGFPRANLGTVNWFGKSIYVLLPIINIGWSRTRAAGYGRPTAEISILAKTITKKFKKRYIFRLSDVLSCD